MKRRDVLGLIGASAVLAGTSHAEPAPARRVERIGVQLYTVRELLGRDVPGTLAALAAAGCVEVETAGYAGLPPERFAQALRAAGLTAPSAHVRLQELADPQTLEAATRIGHRFLVVPVPDFRPGGSLEDYRGLAARLDEAGARCAAAGLQLAYHNHDFEFAAIDGTRPFDLLLERCDPQLVRFELDLYWASKAGLDPATYLGAAPQRFPLCHVKDMRSDGAMTEVGDGTIDFAAAFAAGAGLEHRFIEHDNPRDPLDSVRRSAAALRALRY